MASDSTRLKFEQVCSDCQSSDFVEDHAQGDLVCTVSGRVDNCISPMLESFRWPGKGSFV